MVEAYRRDRILKQAEEISAESGVPVATILGKSHTPSAVRCRHRLMAVLWREGLSIGEVSRSLGMNHTSVMSALRKCVGADEYRAEVVARSGGSYRGKVRVA